MKAIIQRVSSASVNIDGSVYNAIREGYVILLGVADGDTEAEARLLAEKTAYLRIFCDENDKMNRSLLDVGGQVLVISNFTLCADTSHGRRPSFINAMEPQTAEELYIKYMEFLKEQGVKTVVSGQFGADMKVTLTNDGPITIILDTKEWKK